MSGPRAAARRPFLLFALASACAWSQSESDLLANIEATKKRIATVEARLQEDQAKHDRLSRELASSERRIGQLTSTLAQLTEQVKAREDQVAALVREQTEHHAALDEYRDLVKSAVRFAYLTGRTPRIQRLLNRQDPDELGQSLAYYDYINQSNARQMAFIDAQVKRAAALANEMRSARDQLLATQARQRQERQVLATEQNQRAQVLASIEARMHSDEEILATLAEDAKRLDQLLLELRAALADIPAELGGGPPFGSLKGELTWPVAGQLRERFGSARNGDLRWQGLVISAPGRHGCPSRFLWPHRFRRLAQGIWVADHRRSRGGLYDFVWFQRKPLPRGGHLGASRRAAGNSGRIGGSTRTRTVF